MISWQATDEDGDALVYHLYYKKAGDEKWYLLEKELETSFVLLNTLAFPNGHYLFKLVASDEKVNTLESAYRSEVVSGLMTIDNTPPIIEAVTVLADRVEFTVRDEESAIWKLSYSLDKKNFNSTYPLDGVFDDRQEKFVIKKEKDVKEIVVYGQDRFGNVVLKTLEFK